MMLKNLQGAEMASEPRIKAARHRDTAAQFRALADIEPSDSLRQRLQRLAERHDGLAADLGPNQAHDQTGILSPSVLKNGISLAREKLG
jgi:hypothetical protein